MDGTAAQRHFIEIVLILALLFLEVVGHLLGAEPIDHLEVATTAKHGLERFGGQGGRFDELLPALAAALLEKDPVAVLLGQPGGRATVAKVFLHLLMETMEGVETGLQPLLGGTTSAQRARMGLQRGLLAPLAQVPKGCDPGAEAFHDDPPPFTAASKAAQAPAGDTPWSTAWRRNASSGSRSRMAVSTDGLEPAV